MPAKMILVIENDDDTRLGFSEILSGRGYRVALAASGGDGLRYLQTNDPPNLIILDMLMRGMDGWQFLKYRDARWPFVPVLIATALPVASAEWAAELGAHAWLQKPIDETTLVQKVAQCLRSSALIG
jgi:putative two-component system response regulator